MRVLRSPALVVGLLIVVGCGSSRRAATATTTTTAAATTTTAPASHDISGVFVLHSSDSIQSVGLTCAGTGGYNDVGPGMGVTVKNASGTIVGTGTTRNLVDSDSTDTRIGTAFHDTQKYSNTCALMFDVPSVPDAPFYSISVGRRGDLSYSKADLAARGWFVELSLGSAS